MSKPSTRIRNYVNRFESAVRAHEMRGAQHPDDHFEIDQEYKEAKSRLIDYISMLVSKIGTDK